MSFATSTVELDVSAALAKLDRLAEAFGGGGGGGATAVASPAGGGGSAMESALVTAVQLPINQAKRDVPVDTGTLRRSIAVLSQSSDGPKAEVAIGSDAPYAARIEFGFVGTDSLGRRYNQAGQPYLTPAIEQTKDAVAREFSTAMEALIKAALG